jgi:ribosomal protein L7/L12
MGIGMARTLALNAKVERLLRHLNVPEQSDMLPPTVREAWTAGRTVEAVRLLREATGIGLKEARDALKRGILPVDLALEANIDQLLRHYGLSVVSLEMPLPVVIDELARGRTIHAIKAYREATGAGLVEAKHAVEALERQLAQDLGRGR